MIRIAHIADVHLRDRQYAYRTRGRDFANALVNAVNKAIEVKAHAIICAGDLLDSSRPSAYTISEELTKIDKILKAANIPMFVISGNHDQAEAPWTKVFSTIGNKDVGIVCADNKEFIIKGDSGQEVSLLGLPFMNTEEMRLRLDDIRSGNQYYDIITWHGAISEFVGYPNANNLDMSCFAQTCRLVAMGDQHIHKLIEKEIDGSVLTVAYPGSTEMCDEAEDPEKKMYLYHWNNGDLVGVESIPFKTRPVQRFVLNTELDVEDAITKIDPSALIFIKYRMNLKDTLPRLNTVTTAETIIRPVALPATDKKTFANVHETRKLLTSPREFVSEAIKKAIPEEQRVRIEELCLDMVDSNIDYRYSIEKFCADQMEGKIIL